MSQHDSSSQDHAGVYLAAFGKHPGWNDHIDDIGVETARLVGIKRSLYFEGVGGNIDAGTWESLEESQRLPGFGHTWVWRYPDAVVTGRMWASRDGKGRALYPMVVCAQNSDGLLPNLLAGTLPLLRNLEAQCRDSSTASEVVAAVDRTRSELRASASWQADAAGTLPEWCASNRALAKMAEGIGLHDQSPPFHRILYRIERDMAAYLRTTKRGQAANRLPLHIRVPAANDDEIQSLVLWTVLMLTLLDPSVPLLLVRPDDAAWIDILIGEPKAQQYYCLLATPEAVPLASDIPYTIDPPFLEHADTLVNGWRGEGEALDSGLLRVDAYAGDDEGSGLSRLFRPVKGLFGRGA